MSRIFIPIAFLIFLLPSCTKEETEVVEVIEEIQSIDEVTHDLASDILRHCIRDEYGGVFRLMKHYHNLIRVEGVPCDSTITTQLVDESTDKFSLKSEIVVQTTCHPETQGNNRIYLSDHTVSTHTTNSETLALDMNVIDDQQIIGNFEQDLYFYGHGVNRRIFITKGVAAEVEPEAVLDILFTSCQYDTEHVEMTSLTEGSFRLRIKTNENPLATQKRYEGIIRLIDDVWTITYDDGVVAEL